MPMPQPTAGARLAAELLDQRVVAAAAADRALRAEPVGDPLEHGEVVVVHAAHQARVDAVRRARRRRAPRAPPSKCASDAAPRKSISCGAASMTGCIAGFLLSRMRSGLLCRRRRASSSSASACASKWAISAARCARALVGLAEAVELEPHVAALDQAEVAPQRAAHQDQLGVDVRARR